MQIHSDLWRFHWAIVVELAKLPEARITKEIRDVCTQSLISGSFFFSGKLLLMLQSVKRAHAIDPNHPHLHEHLIKLAVKGW